MSVPRSALEALRTDPAHRLEPQPIDCASLGMEERERGLLVKLAFDSELWLVLGVLAALSIWFLLSRTNERPSVARGPASHARPQLRQVSLSQNRQASPFQEVNYTRFTFAGSSPHPAQMRMPEPVLVRIPEPVLAAPQEIPSDTVESHALLAEPAFDVRGSVLLSGLPEGFRLSAGTQVSPSDWALTFGDLDNLIIRLPAERSGPLRTTVDLRTPTGIRIHTFTVEFQAPDAIAAPLISSTGNPGAQSLPAKSDRDARKTLRKARPAPGPPKGVAAPKTASAAPAVATQAPLKPLPPPTATATAAASSTGLFSPDPKDSANTSLNPRQRDDPRFTILRGLGVKPSAME